MNNRSFYDRGYYWCSTCQRKVTDEETYKTNSGVGGRLRCKKCGRCVRTRRRWKRGGSPTVVANVVRERDMR